MGQEKQLRSIEEVQVAETATAKALDDANKSRERAISDAKEKASQIISDAISEARQKKEKAIKKTTAELEEHRKKALESAVKNSKSIKNRRLSPQKRKEVVKKLVYLILGE